MSNYTNEQYNQIFDKLPQEIKDAVASTQTTEHLWKIGQKRNLQIDQIGVMVDITLDLMMGIVANHDFVDTLQKELSIPAFDAAGLARDIDENVLKPIKGIMQDLYKDKAPNRPSSSLVQFYEEDAEHPSMDRDALLKEIEDPTPVKPKIEVNSLFEGSTREAGGVLETEAEVKELHDMANIGKKKVEVVKVNPIKINTEAPKVEVIKMQIPKIEEIKDISEAVKVPSDLGSLEKLASLKLSQSFVMPKGGSFELGAESFEKAIPSPSLKQEALYKPEAIQQSTTPEKVEPDSKPIPPPAPKQYAVDPYREPIV